MDKLELKHLAGYLPYGLKIDHPTFNIGKRGVSELNSIRQNVIEISHRFYVQISDIKPILRPLSDLTKEIEVNGEKFLPIEGLRKEYSGFYFESNPELLIKSKNTSMYIPLNWTNEFQQKLLEWHFDIYGLIEKGLAIDINTI